MKPICILGIFVADTTFRAERQPRMGETILGNSFALGPGGKGSNQSVAAARAGGDVRFLTRLGSDAFADMAVDIWKRAGVEPQIIRDPESYTGAAFIFIEQASGDNAIIVAPGAATRLTAADIDARADVIRSAGIFVTQLEQPIEAARRALEIAREAGVTTILNPAPAAALEDGMFALCDFITPNETEASEMTGVPVASLDDARRAADVLVGKGAGIAIITLGENGVLVHSGGLSEHVPAFRVGAVVETTGAGDAFNGGFAVALSEGKDPVEAARFGCAAAGISVTRPGAANSMPTRAEIDALLLRG